MRSCPTTALALGLVAAPLALAGNLTPPPGPLGSTMKTLDEVEPRTPISQADIPYLITDGGSYYLTGNIDAVDPGAAITVLTSGVSLDLSGFTMDGSPGEVALGSFAVEVLDTVTGLRIANGVIRNWRHGGISAASADNATFIDLTIEANGAQSAGPGLLGGRQCLIERVIVDGSGGVGVLVQAAAVIRACVATNNVQGGIFGASGSEVVDCTASGNGGVGFQIISGSQARGCVALSNGTHGFEVGSLSVTIDCSAVNNTSHGFTASLRSEVRSCRSSLNDGAGIHANSTRSKIFDNDCAQNGTGILVPFAGNVIARNTVSDSAISAYDIAPGNTVGTITNTLLDAGPWDNLRY